MEIFAFISCFAKSPYLRAVRLTRVDQCLGWVYDDLARESVNQEIDDAGKRLMDAANIDDWKNMASIQAAQKISDMTGIPYLGDFENILSEFPYKEEHLGNLRPSH